MNETDGHNEDTLDFDAMERKVRNIFIITFGGFAASCFVLASIL